MAVRVTPSLITIQIVIITAVVVPMLVHVWMRTGMARRPTPG
jgi:hypothetical protein